MTPIANAMTFRPLLVASLPAALLLAWTVPDAAPAQEAAAEFDTAWPNFRGPTFNGTSPTATPPVSWDEDTHVQWKVEIPGSGNNSSPVVWGDRVFVLTAIPESSGDAEPDPRQAAPRRGGRRGGRRRSAPLVPTDFVTICYDRNSGEELWRQVAVSSTPHQATHPDHSFASASPCTDGQRLFAHFGSRGLYCYDLDGKLLWKRDDFGEMQTRNGFGEGSSPVLHGETLVVPWDHEGDSWVLALDARDGSTRWKAERDEPSNWVTPVVVTRDGRDIVITGGENHARAYDLETGEDLWQAAGFTSRPIASPVVHDDKVLLSSARQGFYLSAMDINGSGQLDSDDGIVWSTRSVAPDVPSLLLSGDRLYFMRGSTGVLNCWNAESGEPLYQPARLPDVSGVYASPVAADGKVIVVGRDGTSVVLRDTDEFEVLSVNRLDDRIDATPALAGDQIFLRGKKYLYCIGKP